MTSITADTAAPPPLPVQKLSAPALRAFFNITELWGLSAQQQRALLGSPPPSTFFKWKKQQSGAIPRDVMERISYVIGIYKALRILLPEPSHADVWIHAPNAAPLFGGRSALERMLGGNVADLYAVRSYLDGERGG